MTFQGDHETIDSTISSEKRTLDALHIAAAAGPSDLEALVGWDRRMIAAADAYGLPTASPAPEQ